jgi:acyl-CoA dehydrogenase
VTVVAWEPLSEEQRELRDLVRTIARERVAPRAAEIDKSGEFPWDVVDVLRENEIFALLYDEEFGGTGTGTLLALAAIEELSKVCATTGLILAVQELGSLGLKLAGSDEQKRRFLPRLATGEWLAAYALTEPGSGSDPASLATRAERDGDGWRISGSKIFITQGSWATVALVFARTGGEGARGITAFLVPTASDGYEARRIKGKLGLRAQDTAEVFLDGVRVPETARLGGEGEGFKVAMSALDNGRISLAAGCVGIAQGCLDGCVAYAKERQQFGRPIARFQLVQELLAEMAVETRAARLLTWQAAALSDAGRPHTLESSVAKYYASEASVRAANAAVQVHGGYGYVDEYPVGKYLRDARVTTLYEGTSQVQKLIIGRALTGESAFA